MVVVGVAGLAHAVALEYVCVAFLVEHDDRLDARAESQCLALVSVGNGRVEVCEVLVIAVDDILVVCLQLVHVFLRIEGVTVFIICLLNLCPVSLVHL